MARGNPKRAFSGQISAVFRQTVYQHRFSRYSPTDAWSPAVNVYQLADRLEACVDLAGVERERIDVQVEPGRLLIRGVRQPPEPKDPGRGPMRILNMEIDYGPFRREIPLPTQVKLGEVQSRYTEGMLCITLPLAGTGEGASGAT